MQRANIVLALGGDSGNTVQKFNVTAAEIALLRAIHGGGAVSDVEPTDEVPTNHRAEKSRLFQIYGNATDADNNRIIEKLYPGVASHVFEDLDDLDLDPSYFKAETRATTKKAAKAPAKGKATGPEKQEHAATADAPDLGNQNADEPLDTHDDGKSDDADDTNDGIGDMPADSSQNKKLFGKK